MENIEKLFLMHLIKKFSFLGNVDDLLSKRGIGLKPANNVLGDLKSTQVNQRFFSPLSFFLLKIENILRYIKIYFKMTFAQQGHHVSMKTMVDEDPDPVSSPVGKVLICILILMFILEFYDAR